MGWQPVRDRKKLVRAGNAVGTELDTLWEYVSEHPASKAVHTRAFRAVDGRTGYLYTDGHVDWDSRYGGPWSQ